jgi:hypothetical protein
MLIWFLWTVRTRAELDLLIVSNCSILFDPVIIVAISVRPLPCWHRSIKTTLDRTYIVVSG